MRKLWWWGLMWGGVSAAWGIEPVHGCFATAAEAAAGVVAGPIGPGEGFRLEGVQRDAVLDRSWAVVRSCTHPERPAVMVELLRVAAEGAGSASQLAGDPKTYATVARPAAMPGERGRQRAREAVANGSGSRPAQLTAVQPATPYRDPQTAPAAAPLVLAGAPVEVVRLEQNVRLSLPAIAERSAALGQRVRLRVLRESGESEQFVEGIVRSASLVEMEAGR